MRVLPTLIADGVTQMARDEELLRSADEVTLRRYLWSPPALSLGKFQALPNRRREDVPGNGRGPAAGLPFDVVRRPSGGRAVLHGVGFEWSFMVVFPHDRAIGRSPGAAYDVVTAALAVALAEWGVGLDRGREVPYRRSGLCFTTALRHDLLADGDKIAAVAQARHGGRVLVHGSVLERRPPLTLVKAIEDLFGEPWRGDGLAGAGALVDGEALWRAVVERLAGATGRVRTTSAVGHAGTTMVGRS